MTVILNDLAGQSADEPASEPGDSVTPPAVSPAESALGAPFVLNASLVVLAVLFIGLVLNVSVFGNLQERAAQNSKFQAFRIALATGTAPVGPTYGESSSPSLIGHLIRPGTPMALLKIPSLHLQQVVSEGTSSAVLTSGPGHLRNTPFPGQPGTSFILGRAAAFGGPFGRISTLKVGAVIDVTTQEGTSAFKVIDVRRKGDRNPPDLPSGGARLILETAAGHAYSPSGVLYVDANISSPVLAAAPSGLTTVSPDEKALASDTSNLWALVLWLEAGLAVEVGAVLAWRRWGTTQTWIVFLPLGLLVGHFLFEQVSLLLPNLM